MMDMIDTHFNVESPKVSDYQKYTHYDTFIYRA
jgi:hypothetical protein